MYKDILTQLGLNPNEATVYEFLLQNGQSPAGQIIKKTPLKRGVVYNALDDLVQKGLVSKATREKIAYFSPNHPEKLTEVLENKENTIKKARVTLSANLPDLISSFNLVSEKPGIRFFEGVAGLQKIYDEILADGKDILLVRAAYEPTYEKKILPIVKKFVAGRIKKGIKATAITPSDLKGDPLEDERLLMTRIIVPKKLYDAPVEIDFFGDKIAFLSFGKELIGIIIESRQTSQALRQLFFLAGRNITTDQAASGASS